MSNCARARLARSRGPRYDVADTFMYFSVQDLKFVEFLFLLDNKVKWERSAFWKKRSSLADARLIGLLSGPGPASHRSAWILLKALWSKRLWSWPDDLVGLLPSKDSLQNWKARDVHMYARPLSSHTASHRTAFQKRRLHYICFISQIVASVEARDTFSASEKREKKKEKKEY